MKDDSGIKLSSLKVDGGASASDVMMQFQSDILNTPIYRPKNIETTVTGAAFLAGLATGFWKSKDEIKKVWKVEKVFSPSMPKEIRDSNYEQWKRAIERSKGWEKENN